MLSISFLNRYFLFMHWNFFKLCDEEKNFEIELDTYNKLKRKFPINLNMY